MNYKVFENASSYLLMRKSENKFYSSFLSHMQTWLYKNEIMYRYYFIIAYMYIMKKLKILIAYTWMYTHINEMKVYTYIQEYINVYIT